MTLAILTWTAVAVLLIAGVIGLVLPLIPGPPLLFLGLWLAAWAEDYAYVGAWGLSLLFALMLLAVALDYVAGAMGAKRVGASGWAIWGAVIGAFAGLFFGLPGVLLGPFVGAVAGELIAGNAFERASLAGIGATLGLFLGMAIKLALGISMLGVYWVMRV